MIAKLSLAQVTFAPDITRLGVGARPLGMGKMFTGLADDISSVYLNPAGLAYLRQPEFLSMSGKFVNLVNYLSFAGSAPLKQGTVAIGYAGAGFGFSTPVLNLVEIATGEYRVIPSTNEAVTYDYNNYAVALAYGMTIFRPELSIGSSLKFFNESIVGTSNGSAFGYDMDVGLMYRPRSNVTFGIMGKNIIPSTMGAKLKWDTNHEESIPSSVSVGGSIVSDLTVGKTILGMDYEIQKEIPGLFHAGLEWWLTKTFALRTGIDQDVVGTGTGSGLETTNNLTAGASLNVGGFRFDYAYHRYNNIPTNDTHYVSINYKAPKIIPLEVIHPQDKTITHESTVMVIGRAKDPRIKSIWVNDREVSLKSGTFETEVSLMIGKNTIWVAGFNSKGRIVKDIKLRLLRLVKFPDIDYDFWARDPIEYLATLYIMPGYSDGTFRPYQNIARAKLLINLLNVDRVPPATEMQPFPFKDIRLQEWVAPYAKAGWDTKLTIGYPDKTFRPWRLVNRVEGAVMAVRFSKYELYDVLERPYEDIPARHWAIQEVTSAKQNSLLKFALKYLYPKKDLQRAELASMLSGTPKIKEQIDELLDWERGYQIKFPY